MGMTYEEAWAAYDAAQAQLEADEAGYEAYVEARALDK